MISSNSAFKFLRTSFAQSLSEANLFIKNTSGQFLYGNEKFTHMAGLISPLSILNRSDQDLCWREYTEQYRENDRSALQETIILRGEKFKSYDGLLHDVLSLKIALYDNEGIENGILGIILYTKLYQYNQSIKILKEVSEYFNFKN